MGSQKAFGFAVLLATACVVVLMAIGNVGPFPVIGTFPLSLAVLLASVFGYFTIKVLLRRGIAPTAQAPITFAGIAQLALAGVALAIPPILIDVFLPFPEDMNLPTPDGLFFYPAIGLVAEVSFHLIPLALLALVLPITAHKYWLVLPVVLIEPIFQAYFLQGESLRALLVFFNVGLISAVQLWLFWRHGFLAMFALRIVFYLAWHIIWGIARMELLF